MRAWKCRGEQPGLRKVLVKASLEEELETVPGRLGCRGPGPCHPSTKAWGASRNCDGGRERRGESTSAFQLTPASPMAMAMLACSSLSPLSIFPFPLLQREEP